MRKENDGIGDFGQKMVKNYPSSLTNKGLNERTKKGAAKISRKSNKRK